MSSDDQPVGGGHGFQSWRRRWHSSLEAGLALTRHVAQRPCVAVREGAASERAGVVQTDSWAQERAC